MHQAKGGGAFLDVLLAQGEDGQCMGTCLAELLLGTAGAWLNHSKGYSSLPMGINTQLCL